VVLVIHCAPILPADQAATGAKRSLDDGKRDAICGRAQ